MADLIILRNAIADFSRSMSGASAYAVADLTRYDMGRINKRIDQVFDKLGIERMTYGGNRNYNNGNNFLDNASSKSTSIEEIEDLIS